MNDKDFPHLKTLTNGRIAYVVPLTYGRARINVTTPEAKLFVGDFF